MKEEILRINRLVAEGKLSPEDGAELIEAFVAAGRDRVGASADRLRSRPRIPLKRDVREPRAHREGGRLEGDRRPGRVRAPRSGFEAIKGSFEDLTKGKVSFGLFGNEEKREVRMPISVPGRVSAFASRIPAATCGSSDGPSPGTILADARIRGGTLRGGDGRGPRSTRSSSRRATRSSPCASRTSRASRSISRSAFPRRRRSRCGRRWATSRSTDHPASVRVNTRAGSVRVRGASGVVEVSADSGDVTVEDAESPSVAIDTKSGDLELSRVRGNVNARTAAGDITPQGVVRQGRGFGERVRRRDHRPHGAGRGQPERADGERRGDRSTCRTAATAG